MRDPLPELSVVLPVFNEAEALPSVLAEWLAEFGRLGIRVALVAYDDGSRDGSREVLEMIAAREPRLRVVGHLNRGHGPTILRGYHEASADWVFQVDSDGELTPEGFAGLWARRDDFDVLVGHREGRRFSPTRLAVTLLSRLVVATLFGRGIRDVNAPFRLLRRSSLARLLPLVPENCFAPNVLISGLATRLDMRLLELPVRQQARRGGRLSLTSGRLWRGALTTFRDALRARRRLRRKA